MSRQRSAIEWQDIVAATFVVGTDLIECDYLVPQEAVDNLPNDGGSVYVLQGSYTSTAAVTLPVDKPVAIVGCGDATILNFSSNGVAVFTFPNGYSQSTRYLIENLRVIFDATAGQDFIKISDAGGYVSVDVYNCNIYRPAKLVNFTAYDVTYNRPNNVTFHGGSAEALDGVRVLVAGPAVAGTYGGPAWVGFEDMDLEPGVTGFWVFDADVDIVYSSLNSEALVPISGGSAIDGFCFHGAFLTVGNGDFTINGVSWSGGSAIIASTMGGSGVNSRIICGDSGSTMQGYISDLCFKFGDAAAPTIPKTQSFACFFSGSGIDMANPAIELVGNGGVVADCYFQVRYPNGCIKITNAKFCKIHDNNFGTSLTGKTIIESGTADENDIHDNSGMLNGTGLTIIGPKTKINNSVLADKATSTTNALVEIVPTITNPKGLFGIGTIKNTDGANALDVKESFTDAFGVTSTLTTTVAFGDSLQLGLQQNIGTGLPPYVSYKAEVIDTVAASHATYVSHFVSQGSL